MRHYGIVVVPTRRAGVVFVVGSCGSLSSLCVAPFAEESRWALF